MTTQTKKSDSVVFLVDDDVAVQHGVSALLKAADYDVKVFSSGEEFLDQMPGLNMDNAVALVDVCMPGIQGLELQEKLYKDGVSLPIVVMTAHGDVPMAVRAMRNGAVDFLEKPFTVEEVTTSLNRALAITRIAATKPSDASTTLETKFSGLTPRELDVFREIVAGATNKEIARTLELSPRTVEVHRHNIMRKMEAGNLAELVRMAVALNI